MKTIEIIVTSTGKTQLETKGYTGNECDEASRLLERALGSRSSEHKTAEYFQATQTQHRLQEGR